MALSAKQKKEIKAHVVDTIRTKLDKYNPETTAMPFQYRLLGKNKMATFSFIHSVNTTLGASIFEPVAEMIVKPHAKRAVAQYEELEGLISSGAILKIDSIIRELNSKSRKPNQSKETKEIIAVALKGEQGELQKKRVDLFVEMNNTEYYFELKTAKPNKGGFVSFKKELLELIAMRGSQDPNVKMKTILAIPYNPYEPKEYNRWTLEGKFELGKELLVGKDFWDFLGGEGTYEDLLKVFEQAGKELNDEIEEKVNSLTNRK